MIDPFYVQLYQKKPSSAQLSAIIQHIYSLQTKRNFVAIDKILGEINFKRLDSVIIVALLRSNNPIRSMLKNWNAFFDKATKQFEADNNIVALRGLEKE